MGTRDPKNVKPTVLHNWQWIKKVFGAAATPQSLGLPLARYGLVVRTPCRGCKRGSLFESGTLLNDVRTGYNNDTIIECFSIDTSFVPLELLN